MANPSNEQNAREAQARIAENLARAAAAPETELQRLYELRREQVLIVAAKMWKQHLVNVMDRIYESTNVSAELERSTEECIMNAQMHDVYSRAVEAIEARRLNDYIESVRRQLYHATLNVRANNSIIGAVTRAHYISARAKFLKELDPAEVDRLSGLSPK